jgi:hypothetical protein
MKRTEEASMAANKRGEDRIGALVREVEALARRLRADIRKRARAAGVEKRLRVTADRMRKLAASIVAQVEKYAHEIRKELEGGAKPAKRPTAKKRRPPTAPPAAS